MSEPKTAKPDPKPAAGDFPLPDPAALARNLIEVGKKSQKLISDYLSRREQKPGGGWSIR